MSINIVKICLPAPVELQVNEHCECVTIQRRLQGQLYFIKVKLTLPQGKLLLRLFPLRLALWKELLHTLRAFTKILQVSKWAEGWKRKQDYGDKNVDSFVSSATRTRNCMNLLPVRLSEPSPLSKTTNFWRQWKVTVLFSARQSYSLPCSTGLPRAGAEGQAAGSSGSRVWGCWAAPEGPTSWCWRGRYCGRTGEAGCGRWAPPSWPSLQRAERAWGGGTGAEARKTIQLTTGGSFHCRGNYNLRDACSVKKGR